MNKHTSPENKIGQPFLHCMIDHGMINNQYAWSHAGMTNAVAETNAFDHLDYIFDRKGNVNFKARAPITEKPWTDSQPDHRHMLANQRKCRHMLNGLVVYKLCGHGYDCVRCPYDQMVQDRDFRDYA